MKGRKRGYNPPEWLITLLRKKKITLNANPLTVRIRERHNYNEYKRSLKNG